MIEKEIKGAKTELEEAQVPSIRAVNDPIDAGAEAPHACLISGSVERFGQLKPGKKPV